MESEGYGGRHRLGSGTDDSDFLDEGLPACDAVAELDSDPPLGEMFPTLQASRAMEFDSPEITRLVVTHGDRLTLGWIRNNAPSTNVGSLLAERASILLSWRHIGPTKRDRIVQLLSRLDSELNTKADRADGHLTALSMAADIVEPTLESPDEGVNVDEEWQQAVRRVATWAASTSGALTWGDLVTKSLGPFPSDVGEAWATFAGHKLPLDEGTTASDVVERYLGQIGELNAAVLLERMVGPRKLTLDDLGVKHGLSRERIRQIERSVSTQIRTLFDESEPWRPIRWVVEALHQRVGAFAPQEFCAQALPAMDPIARRVVGWLAGYRYDGQFFVLGAYRLPTIDSVPRLSLGARVVDEFALVDSLTAAGVLPEFLDCAIDAINGVWRVDGQLVDWTGSQVDRAVAMLEVRDEPQVTEELFDLAGGGSLQSFRNRAFTDPRIIRVTKSKLGLRQWGGTHYTTIVDLMVARLASGPMTIEDLGRELERTYEVSANSVSMYAFAPIFRITGDLVGLRGRSDPFVPRHKPSSIRGLVQTGPSELLWHIKVDHDAMRGSGQTVPQEIGTFVGIGPSDDAILLDNAVAAVRLSWLETSHLGPQIGSLRAHALAGGAQVGDVLRLRFDRARRRLDVEPIQPARADESPPERLSRLSGLRLDQCTDLSALAQAVGVGGDEVVDVLERRRDTQLAEAASEVAGPSK